MDVVILAGGKGKRLGVLTSQRQKATLPFRGNALLTHVLDSFIHEDHVERIHVLTGYCSRDIHEVLSLDYSGEVMSGKISCIDLPGIVGTLSRLNGAVSQIETKKGCLVCGIDSLVPMTILQRFYSFIDRYDDDLILSFSPHLQIASTHKVGIPKKFIV